VTYNDKQPRDNTPTQPDEGLKTSLVIAEEREQHLFKYIRKTERRRKRPPQNTGHGKPEDAL
jgi:hypothetical protein